MELNEQLSKAQAMRTGSSTATSPDTKPAAKTREILIPTTFGSIRTLVHEPADAKGPLPIFISFHGGGFVVGAPEDDAEWCEFIAAEANVIVVNVDYPLAPESKFPVPVEASFEVVKWIHAHAEQLNGNPDKIAVGGHSAGGNIAAAVALTNNDQGSPVPISLQILDYPPLDLATDPAYKPDFEEAIPPDQARLFNLFYLQAAEDAVHHLASPLYAAELRGLPEALIITAEHDSLAEEARQYAKRLERAGVTVAHTEYEGAAHAFTHHGDPEQAKQAWQQITRQLKHHFH